MQNNLKAIRIARGLTQKQVATLLKMKCQDRLSHWERGSAMPSVGNLYKLAAIYKVSLNQLFNQ